MEYSIVAILSILVHCIVNFDTLINRHFNNNTPAGKAYRQLIVSFAAFFLFDILWGFVYDAKLKTAVIIDTELYFIAMAATILMWTRFVICYLNEKNLYQSLIKYTGWAFLILITVSLIVNIFTPVMFRLDENNVYHTESFRYVILCVQIVLFLSSSFYVLITADKKDRRTKRRHLAIGFYGAAMGVTITIQALNPLLPLYSAGCLLGSCILHTFVLEDLKEVRRLELEDMVRKEKEHKKALGNAMHMAYTDPLTGIKNSLAYIEAEEKTDERISSGDLTEFGVVVFDVNGLKLTNDTKGHDAGDILLKDACRLICTQFKHSPVFRIGGDEFVAILENEDFRNRVSLLSDFENTAEDNLQNNGTVVASGLAVFKPGDDDCYRVVFERADERMYERKKELKSKNR